MSRKEYLNNKLEMLNEKVKIKEMLSLHLKDEIFQLKLAICELRQNIIEQEMWEAAKEINKDRRNKNE